MFVPYADPERGAAIIRVNAFRDFFVQQGHSVSIIAPKRKGVTESKGIYRFANPINLATFILKNNFDAVFGTSPPLPNNFVALLACKIKGIPFVLDGKDDAIALLDKKNRGYNSTLKYASYMALRDFVYKNADYIFVLTKEDAEIEAKRYSLPKEKFVLVMNGTDIDVIKNDDSARKEIRKTLGINENDLLLAYAGSFGDEEVIPFIQNSADLIKTKDIRVLLVLAIDDSKKQNMLNQINSAAAELSISNKIHIVLNIPYTVIYKYFSAADIAIMPWPDYLMTSLPAKIFDYMAAELPIVIKGSKTGSLAAFFNENPNIGFYSDNWQAVIENIKKLNTDKKLRKEIGIANRKMAIAKFQRIIPAKIALGILQKTIKIK